jgi:hypothetical protein
VPPGQLAILLCKKHFAGISVSTLFNEQPVLATYRTCYDLVILAKFEFMMTTSYLVVALVRFHFPQCFDMPDRVLSQRLPVLQYAI